MPAWKTAAMKGLDAVGIGDLVRLSRGALAEYG